MDGSIDPTGEPLSEEIDSTTGTVVTDSENGPSSESAEPVESVEVVEPGEPVLEASQPTVDSAKIDGDSLPTGSPVTDSLGSNEVVSETDAVRVTTGGGASYLFGLFLM